jgi:hypothetical protein
MPVICPTCQGFSLSSNAPMTWRAERSDENRLRQALHHPPTHRRCAGLRLSAAHPATDLPDDVSKRLRGIGQSIHAGDTLLLCMGLFSIF